jgi:hypothetical protein
VTIGKVQLIASLLSSCHLSQTPPIDPAAPVVGAAAADPATAETIESERLAEEATPTPGDHATATTIELKKLAAEITIAPGVTIATATIATKAIAEMAAPAPTTAATATIALTMTATMIAIVRSEAAATAKGTGTRVKPSPGDAARLPEFSALTPVIPTGVITRTAYSLLATSANKGSTAPTSSASASAPRRQPAKPAKCSRHWA